MSKRKLDDADDVSSVDTAEVRMVLSRFKSDTDEILQDGLLNLPVNITVDKLQAICNSLLQQEESLPLAFYVNNVEVTDTLEKYVGKDFSISEDIVEIVYQPQAVFRVRAVTRCTGSLEGFRRFYI